MELKQRLWRTLMRKKKLSDNVMETELSRCLGTWELMLFGLGHMMGAGIYVVTGSVVANIAGPATVLSYAIAGFAAFLSAICYAEFAAMVPKAGSAYTYTYVTIGEFWGFVIGWNIILEHLISVASVARAWSATFMTFFPTGSNITEVETDQSLAIKPDFIGPITVGMVTIFLVIGAKVSAGVNNVLTVTNAVVIVVVAIGGFSYANLSVFEDGFMPYGLQGTIGGAAVCFYAFIGFEGITIAGEEARDPAKSMPKAIMGAMVIATTAYVTVTLALVLMVPYFDVDSSAAFPIAFSDKGVEWLKYVVTTGSLFGITASMLGSAFALSRSVYALAHDGVFFKLFAKVNSKTQTPIIAILAFNFLAAVTACLFEVEVLVNIMSIGTLLAYSIVAANIVVLRYIPTQNDEVRIGTESPEPPPISAEVKPSYLMDKETVMLTEKSKNVGKLKTRYKNFPLLRNYEAGRVVLSSLFLLVILLIAVSCLVTFGGELLLDGECWIIILVIILILAIILTLLVISAHQQNDASVTFQLPFVPLVPAISIFINVTLMLQLSTLTWLRLLVWQTIGFIIYFAYGIRHSKENVPMGASNSMNYSTQDESVQPSGEKQRAGN